MFQAVLDFEVHIFNLTRANMPGNEPEWYQEYSAKVHIAIQYFNDCLLLCRVHVHVQLYTHVCYM